MACTGSGVQIPSAPQTNMNLKYIREIFNQTKDLIGSQSAIAIISVIQVSFVVNQLGPAKYGAVVLLIAVPSLIFRASHARNSDVNLLVLKDGKNFYFESIFFNFITGIGSFLLCIVIFTNPIIINSSLGDYFGIETLSNVLLIYLLTRIIQTFSETSKSILIFHNDLRRYSILEISSVLVRFIALVFLLLNDQEIEELGGMTKAVELGLPKRRIEESAAIRQAKVDSGEEVIVGVNKYVGEDEQNVEVRDVDNLKVRLEQIERLKNIKSSRDEKKCIAALNNMKLAARDGTGNILALAIEAARERATVGEMSYALEEVYTRYSTTSEVGKGQYVKSFKNKKEIEQTIDIVDSFTRMEGRKPKMLVVKMGQDGHDRGAKVIASAFIDFGFDVKVGPLFQTPSEAAEDALNGKFDIIGISTQAAGHKTLAPQLIEELEKRDGQDMLVICGGVIPHQDHKFLKDSGVSAIFGPGTNIPRAADEIIQLLFNKKGRNH